MLRLGNLSNHLSKVSLNMTLKKAAPVTMVASKSKSMMAFEDKLPHLPVPPLKQSLDRYIHAIEPLLFENEYENTKKVVSDFAKPGGIGEFLQNKLVEKSKKSDNWLADWWDSCAYFAYRASVVINSSPGVAYPAQTFHNDLDRYRYSAKVIHAAMRYKELIDTDSVPVDYAGKSPLAMLQYKKIFSSCRIPYPKEDGSIYASPDESKHVIIMHNNHFFKLNIYKADGETLLNEDELVHQIKCIVDMSPNEDKFPVGVLTAQDRNIWAQGYQRLSRDPQNRENLSKIHKSVFLMCLDQPVSSTDASKQYESGFYSTALAQNLHGGGIEQNSSNRWFDKAIQFTVNPNGMIGVCYEHSPAEGPPVMNVGNEIMKIKFEPDPSYVIPQGIDLEKPEKLSWNLNNDLIDRIDLAKDYINSSASDLDLRLFKFDEFGKNLPKRHKISPDAFFQVTLQLAYYRLHMHHPPTYESGSLRKYSRGRTETIRSSTPECARYVREMDRTRLSDSEKRALFLKAVAAHVQYTKQAMNMEAFDRHMLGLKLTAIENGIPLPEIFRDKAFGYALHFRLSTSQVASPFEAVLCFGPVVPDGYGVCYNPMEKKFIYAVSAFNSHPKTHAADFGEQIAKALKDNEMLLATQSKL